MTTNNNEYRLTTPVGRMVGGSLYVPRETDYDGKPLTIKTGPNAGKPTKKFSFGVAFQKTPGATHWAQEAWLLPIWNLAHGAFPNGEAQRPDFSWKITDGDSTVPNKAGKKPCDQEGYPGHWVLWFSSQQAPRIWDRNGTQQILEPNAVKPGYYIQVFGNVTDNKPSKSPGLYMNHSMVSYSAYGTEIIMGPDVAEAGFGAAPLPAGAMATPPAGAFNPAAPAVPGFPGASGAPAPLVPGLPMTPNVGNTGPLSAPVPPPALVPVSPMPVTSAKVLTSKAGAHSYDQLIASGWTDALLVQHGYMLAPAAAPAVPTPLVPSGSVPALPGHAPIVPAAIPVTPSAAFVAVPAAPVAPAAPVGRTMLPAANGLSYEAYIQNGWTDAMLVQHGYMAA